MDSKKRDFHDLSGDELSEEEDRAEEDSRFDAISKKKRRISTALDYSENSASEEDFDLDSALEDEKIFKNDEAHSVTPKPPNDKLKPITPSQLEASQRKAKKTGVVYISRVPPFMKPATLRKLLSPYGEISRIFLTPEPTPTYKKRVRAGGNKKKSFVDGWVEFVSKKRAKECVDLLNGNLIGGKKSGFYHDDIWNLKYLKGFKWSDLMEQVQVEERMREGRLRAELEKEAKERKAFMTNIGIAKYEELRGSDRRPVRQRTHNGVEDNAQTATGPVGSGLPSVERRFKQRNVQDQKKSGPEADNLSRVLRNIF